MLGNSGITIMPAKYVDPFDNDLPEPDTGELYTYIVKDISCEYWEQIESDLEREGIDCIWLEWTKLSEPRVLITKRTANKLKTLYDLRMDGPYDHVGIQAMSNQ